MLVGPNGIEPGIQRAPTDSHSSFNLGGGSPWSAIADFAVGAVDAYSEYRTNKKNREFYAEQQDKSNEFNAEQAQLSYERTRDLYDYQFAKESAYNSPLAQMQRLKTAGINPALFFGNGVDAGGVNASPSAVGAASSTSPNVPQLQNPFNVGLQGFLSLVQGLSDVKNKNVDSDKKYAEIEKTLEDINLTKSEKSKILQETENLAYVLKDILPTQYKHYTAQIEQILQNMENSQQLTGAQVRQLDEVVNDLKSQIILRGKQGKKLDAELDGYEEYIKNLYRDMSNRADISDSDAYVSRMLKNYEEKVMKYLEDTTPDSMSNDMIFNLIKLYMLKTMLK